MEDEDDDNFIDLSSASEGMPSQQRSPFQTSRSKKPRLDDHTARGETSRPVSSEGAAVGRGPALGGQGQKKDKAAADGGQCSGTSVGGGPRSCATPSTMGGVSRESSPPPSRSHRIRSSDVVGQTPLQKVYTTRKASRPTTFPPRDPVAVEKKLHLSKVIQSSLHMYPDIDPTSEPPKPPLPPGLYTLVEQSGDIILLELLTDV